MITFLDALPVGNAVRCLFAPTAGATAWKVLRRLDQNFTGVDDTVAVVVADGDRENFIDQPLVNGVQVFYQGYSKVADVWAADGPYVSIVPALIGEDAGADAQELVRERLEWGLKAEVDAGTLKHDTGAIPTLSGPPLFEDAVFPIVTVHLASQAPMIYAIGELIAVPEHDDDADVWDDFEGRINKVNLTIVGWVINNPDTRIKLRKAINRILTGNLPIFADAGLELVEWSAQDTEDFTSYGVAMFQTVFTFSCLAPSAFVGASPTVHSVDLVQTITA